MEEEGLLILEKNLSEIRVPNDSSLVYKDECAYSYHCQESDGGIYIDMNSFIGFSPSYALLNFQRTGHKIYLNIFKTRIPKKPKDENQEQEKPKILGLGVEGGFVDKSRNFDYEYHNQIVILPENIFIPLPNDNIPLKVQQSVDAILSIESASMKKAVDSFLITEERKISKYAHNLLQLDNGVKIPRSGWKCAKCDLTENLWLNLTDGMILCGRKIHGGFGGNGHALEHYEKTNYPLVVKLGTITPDGNADVFSYAPDENDMVIDPYLDEHLKHFGIDMSEMKKTEKSLAEMEIAFQFSFEWNRISEGDKELKPLYGPGYTGMFNLGNTCYMASIMQVLASIPEFADRYIDQKKFIEISKKDPPVDFFIQLSKLYNGLLSGKHSFEEKNTEKEEESDFPKFSENGISPKMFKALVGHNHPEFGSNRQQDASEFYQYIIQMIDRNEHAIGETNFNPTRFLKFKFEDRIQCQSSMKVRYTSRVDNLISLPIPIDKAKNLAEYNEYLEKQAKKTEEELEKEKKDKVEPVRPIINLIDCFEAFVEPEQLENYYSTAIKANTTAVKTTKFMTMPKYLMIQMRKFDLSSGWVPKKLDVLIDVPDEIDLEKYRSKGKQPSEEELPIEENNENQESEIEPQWDESVVQILTSMDIPLIRAQRASMATKSDANEAMEWLFNHLDDPDIDKPIEQVKKSTKASDEPSDDLINLVVEMGFTRDQARIALKKTGNDVERAIDYLFSHDHIEDDESNTSQPKEELISDDGEGKYELFAFITHIGLSTMSGHYVCHIKKDGRWVYYNDEKVAESQNPPKEMAYLYLYRRKN